MIVAWIYLLHFALFLLPGMALAVYARRLRPGRPDDCAPRDDELSTTIIGSCLVGYVVFWVYFANPLYGKLASLIVVALSLPVVFSHSGRDTFFVRKCIPGYWWPFGLMLMTGLFCLGLCFLYGGYEDARNLSGQRFLYPYYNNVDHYLPASFAERILSGESLHTSDLYWKTSDRPPLQCGLWLLHSFFSIWDRNLDYLITGMILQTIWIPGLMVLLRCFNISKKNIVIVYLFIIFSGMALFNTTFPWPKLLPAGLLFIATAYLLQDPNCHAARIRAGLFGGTAFGLALLGHNGSLFALPAIGIIILAMKKISMLTVIMAALATVALMVPWSAYKHFVDPPGNNIALIHLAGITTLGDKRSLLEAMQHSYGILPAAEIIRYKLSNLMVMFGDVYQVPNEWSTIPRDAKHLFRDTSYCSLFWALGLLNLGFAFLGVLHRHDRVKRHERRVAIVLLVACSVTVVLWLLALFGPGMATIYIGTHFVPLAVMTALALLIANASRPLALILAAVNAVLFYWVYVPWPEAPLMMDTVMLTIAGLAFVVIVGLLYWYYRQPDNIYGKVYSDFSSKL